MVKGSPMIVPRPRQLRRASTDPSLPTFPPNVEVQSIPQRLRMREFSGRYREDADDGYAEVCEMRVKMPRNFKHVKYVKQKGKCAAHLAKGV